MGPSQVQQVQPPARALAITFCFTSSANSSMSKAPASSSFAMMAPLLDPDPSVTLHDILHARIFRPGAQSAGQPAIGTVVQLNHLRPVTSCKPFVNWPIRDRNHCRCWLTRPLFDTQCHRVHDRLVDTIEVQHVVELVVQK